MMARRKTPQEPGDWLVPTRTTAADVDEESSLLDVLDTVLNRGAFLDGDLVLGVANVDLIYVRLSVLLAAFDKVARPDPKFKPTAARPKNKRRR